MPSLSEYPTSSETLPILAAAELATRTAEHQRAWDYYEGRQKKFLKVRDGEPDYNVIVNLCARVVDQSVNFMAGEPPTFDLPGDSAEVEAREALLEAWLELYDWPDLVMDLFTASSVCGHAFVKLVPQTDGGVRPVVLDPSLVTVYWNAMDKSDARAYMILWSETVNNQVRIYREDHVRQDGGNAWDVINYAPGDGRSWVEAGRTVWPWPFSQIADWKNLPAPRGYYGKSDISGVIALNDSYNFRQSNTNKILYIHAHPRTIGIGMKKSELSTTSVDGFWAIDNPDAKISNLEMQSDLESSRRHAEDTKADFFGDSQTVDLSTVKDKAGALTNFGLRLMFSEALAKNTKKRRLAGKGMAELVRRAGLLMGVDWAMANVQWADPLPENREEMVKQGKEEIAMEVTSRQTVSERLGNDWEREQARMADEGGADQQDLGTLLANAMRDQAGGVQVG